MEKVYITIIDTENYAGNFERDMCGYITGQYGECGVGYELAENFKHEIKHAGWWDENIHQNQDENGCERPVAIVPTPGWYNNGYGGHFRNEERKGGHAYPAYMSVGIYSLEEPTQQVIDEVTERAKYFCDNQAELSRIARRHSDSATNLTFTGVRVVEVNMEDIQYFIEEDEEENEDDE